mmetsp:Transcript_19371/g.39703  ORF Transcript_19371/g.39703 Transcript_19371/m.39703 type:complete len:214 (-) Transcript_19371:667-1308(-)
MQPSEFFGDLIASPLCDFIWTVVNPVGWSNLIFACLTYVIFRDWFVPFCFLSGWLIGLLRFVLWRCHRFFGLFVTVLFMMLLLGFFVTDNVPADRFFPFTLHFIGHSLIVIAFMVLSFFTTPIIFIILTVVITITITPLLLSKQIQPLLLQPFPPLPLLDLPFLLLRRNRIQSVFHSSSHTPYLDFIVGDSIGIMSGNFGEKEGFEFGFLSLL